VQGGAQVREDLTLRGIDLVFITGTNYSGVKAPAGAAAGSATTASTAPSTTVTTAKAGAGTTTTGAANAGAPAQPQC
jgi:hypothetical protein